MCGGLSTNLQASLGTGVEVSPEGGSQQEHVLSLRMLLDWGKEWKYSVQDLQNKNTVRSARASTVTARLSNKNAITVRPLPVEIMQQRAPGIIVGMELGRWQSRVSRHS